MTAKCYYDGTVLTSTGRYINNSENILRGDLMSLDQIHPNTEGSQFLAMNLVNGLQTGSCDPSSEFKYLYDTNDNILGVVQTQNNITTFVMYPTEYTYSGTADGTEIAFKTIKDNGMISGHAGLSLTANVMFTGSGEYSMGTCEIKINQRVMTLIPYGLNAAGTAFKTFTTIRFYNAVYVIPHKCI